MGQEDGLLMQPSKYFSYILVPNRIYLLSSYSDQRSADPGKDLLKSHARSLPCGRRNPESRSETSQGRDFTCCEY